MQPASNEYELTDLIGRGPNGSVWRAQDCATGEQLAVKVLDARFAADPAVVDRLVRERDVLGAFTHPADVRVRELISHDGDLALVTELVPGIDVRRHLDREGPFEPAVAARIAAAAAEALAAAHVAGLVHGDLKPANLLLVRSSGEVRITDHRLARLVRGYADGPDRFGDPSYAAPEVILGGPPVPASDVYGLGLVLYEMLTGVPLCHGGDPINVLSQHLRRRPSVPVETAPGLRRLVEECLAVNPENRPLAAEAADWLKQSPPMAYGEPAGYERAGFEYEFDYDTDRAEHAGRPDRPDTDRAEHAGRPDLAGDAGWADGGRPVGDRAAARADRPPRIIDPPLRPGDSPRPPTDLLAPAGRRPLRGQPAILVTVAAVLLVAGLVAAGLAVLAAGHRPVPRAGSGTAAGRPPDLTAGASVPQPPPSSLPATADGATSFTRYWFATLGYATATGNTGPLDAASSPDCDACAAASKALRAAYAGGGSIQGGEYTIRTITVDNFFNAEAPRLGVVFDRGPRSTVSADGKQSSPIAGTTFATAQVVLERTGTGWRVRSAQSAVPVA